MMPATPLLLKMVPQVFLLAWLWFAATCLANKLPSAAIEFSTGSAHQRRYHESKHYDADEAVFGPLVPRMLGTHNQSELLGRADPGEPGTDGYGPLIRVPGCLWCPQMNVALKRGRELLETLTTQKMQSYMRISSPDDLKNKCVFYSAAVNKPPEYLSEAASIWACKHKKYSIWHLWPNKFMADGDAKFKDFYGIFETDNWLHSIVDMTLTPADKNVPTTIQYFENMSEAMARSCSGEVVIMTQTPSDMDRYMHYPNIWKNKERPALINLKNQGKISRFLVVDYYDQDKIYEFNIEKNTIDSTLIPPGDLLSRDLHDRAACESSGLAQMPPMGDPFSDDYSKFA